ncbi:MAG TPA: hypothetical protein VIC54_02905 [Terriglobales bacterium]|jgi:hypothetical protein
MRLAAMFALLSLAQALSIAGTWSATINSPGGSFAQVFTFHDTGKTLTGTMVNGRQGTVPLSNIVVQGDQIHFDWIENSQGQNFDWKYAGVIHANEMDLTLTVPMGGKTIHMIAKRAANAT